STGLHVHYRAPGLERPPQGGDHHRGTGSPPQAQPRPTKEDRGARFSFPSTLLSSLLAPVCSRDPLAPGGGRPSADHAPASRPLRRCLRGGPAHRGPGPPLRGPRLSPGPLGCGVPVHVVGVLTPTCDAAPPTVTLALRHAGLILGLALLVAVGRYFWRMYINGPARLLDYTLRQRLLEHLQSLSPSFFDRHKTGDLMAHATNDIHAIRHAMGPGIVMAVDSLFLSVATLVSMFLVANWRLTLLASLPLPFLAWAVTHFGGQIHRRFRRVQEAFAQLTDTVQENLWGVRVIRSFAQEAAEEAKFARVNE